MCDSNRLTLFNMHCSFISASTVRIGNKCVLPNTHCSVLSTKMYINSIMFTISNRILGYLNRGADLLFVDKNYTIDADLRCVAKYNVLTWRRPR